MKTIFQFWLFAVISLAFLIMFGIAYLVQTNLAIKNARSLMFYKLADAREMLLYLKKSQEELVKLRGANTIAKANALSDLIEQDPKQINDPDWMKNVANLLEIDQIRVYDKEFYVVAIYPPKKDFSPRQYKLDEGNYAKLCAPFARGIQDKNYSIFQEVLPKSIFNAPVQLGSVSHKNIPGGVAIGYNADRFDYWRKELTDIRKLAAGFRVGKNGLLLVADLKGNILSSEIKFLLAHNLKDVIGETLWKNLEKQMKLALENYNANKQSIIEALSKPIVNVGSEPAPIKSGKKGYNRTNRVYKMQVANDTYYAIFSLLPIRHSSKDGIYEEVNNREVLHTEKDTIDWYLLGASMSSSEIFAQRDQTLKELIVIYLVLFIVVFYVLSHFVQKVFVNGIHKINQSLSRITQGNLDEKIAVSSCLEFENLSNGINQTVDSLKSEIHDKDLNVQKELQLARRIQRSALPNIFPPYPDRKDIDIFAIITPAREIGGDFFEFQLVNDKTLNFVIADVSGKGIPAAMFMMLTKVQIHSLFLAKKNLAQIANETNNYLFQNNDAGMFVTVFLASLDLETGLLHYINAGHPAPLLQTEASGTFEWIVPEDGNSPILGLVSNIEYTEHEMKILPGSKIFLYTDGVSEATNSRQELYSEKRLQETLNFSARNIKQLPVIMNVVLDDIDKHVGQYEQSDDITMLVISLEKNG